MNESSDPKQNADYWRDRAERVEKAAREMDEAFGPDSKWYLPWSPKLRALRKLRAALEDRDD